MTSPIILPARHEADLRAAAQLMRLYAAGLGLDLGYQGFEAELAALPGAYAPPGGALLLARDGASGPALGCVAVRPLPSGAAGTCEMKRLFVAPEGRGRGLGRHLAVAALREGARLGYHAMVLDTLERLEAATALYRDLGFRAVPPFHEDRVPELLFLGRTLEGAELTPPG